MIPNSRSDLFLVELPKVFIPEHIKKLYKPYVFRMPILINNVSDLVNYSIQSISIPTFNYEPVQQMKPKKNSSLNNMDRHIGKEINYRSSINPLDLPDRNFTITFQLLDGYVNYWILLQTFHYYYDFDNRKLYTFDVPVRITDGDGNIMFTVMFHDVLFTGMSEFQISYSDVVQEFKTFDCTFRFNEMRMKFEID